MLTNRAAKLWSGAAVAVGVIALIGFVIGAGSVFGGVTRPVFFAVVATIAFVLLGAVVAANLPFAPGLSVLVVLGGVFLLLPGAGVGDPSWPTIVGADGPIWLSSPGGHLLVAAFLISPLGLLGYQVAALVVLGIASVVLISAVPWIAGPGMGQAISRVALVATLASVPVAAFMRPVNWETTAFAPGIGLLGFALVVRAVLSEPGWCAAQVAMVGLVLGGVAAGIHPAAVVLAPGLIVLATGLLVSAGVGSRLKAAAFSIAATLAGVAAILLLAIASGRGLTTGDAGGGGDGQILPPDILGSAHWQVWGTAVLVAGGAAAVCLLAVAAQRLLGRLEDDSSPDLLPAAVVLAGTSVVAVFLWGFDLGFPADANVMGTFGLGVPAAAALGVIMLARRYSGAWIALGFAIAGLSVAVATGIAMAPA